MQSQKLQRALTDIGIEVGSMLSIANQLRLPQDGYTGFLKEVISESVNIVSSAIDIVIKFDGGPGFTDNFDLNFNTGASSDVDKLAMMRFKNLRLLKPLQEIYSSYSIMSRSGETAQLPDELKQCIWDLINTTLLVDVYLTRASKGIFEV